MIRRIFLQIISSLPFIKPPKIQETLPKTVGELAKQNSERMSNSHKRFLDWKHYRYKVSARKQTQKIPYKKTKGCVIFWRRINED